MKRVGFAAAALATLAGVLLGGGAVNAQSAPDRTITVISVGEARAEPDVAFVGAGVQADGATPREALSAVNDQMASVLTAIQAAGIAPADIQTSGLNLFTLTGPPEPGTGGPPRTTGYRASNTVSVTIRDINRVETIVDVLLDAGATNLNGLRFGVADEAALHARALEDAVQRARPLAEATARAAGLTLGPVASITELSSGGGPEAQRAMGLGAGGDFVATGTLVFSVRLQVTYQVGS
jgi:uncharacterized protein YggE